MLVWCWWWCSRHVVSVGVDGAGAGRSARAAHATGTGARQDHLHGDAAAAAPPPGCWAAAGWLTGGWCGCCPCIIGSAPILLPAPLRRVQAKPLYLSPASLRFELPVPVVSRHTEVAVLGRSNVGKSSLISALLHGDSQLVRVSKTPGTAQVPACCLLVRDM